MPPKTTSPPLWLRRWRRLIANLYEFIWSVGQSVLYYGATSLRPLLRDLILEGYHRLTSPTCATMLSTTTAAEHTARARQSYPCDPAKCSHENGLRHYGGGGYKLRICDSCGSRWKVATTAAGTETLIRAVAKSSPSSATPLVPKAKAKNKAKAKAQASSSTTTPTAVSSTPPPPPPAEAHETREAPRRRSASARAIATTANSKSAPRSLYASARRGRQQDTDEFAMYTEDSERGEGSIYSSFGQRSMDQDDESVQEGYEEQDFEENGENEEGAEYGDEDF